MSFTFTHQADRRTIVEMTLPTNDNSLTEVLEEFVLFLRAVGSSVPLEARLDLIDEEKEEANRENGMIPASCDGGCAQCDNPCVTSDK